jgi:hypothetical protein
MTLESRWPCACLARRRARSLHDRTRSESSAARAGPFCSVCWASQSLDWLCQTGFTMRCVDASIHSCWKAQREHRAAGGHSTAAVRVRPAVDHARLPCAGGTADAQVARHIWVTSTRLCGLFHVMASRRDMDTDLTTLEGTLADDGASVQRTGLAIDDGWRRCSGPSGLYPAPATRVCI